MAHLKLASESIQYRKKKSKRVHQVSITLWNTIWIVKGINMLTNINKKHVK